MLSRLKPRGVNLWLRKRRYFLIVFFVLAALGVARLLSYRSVVSLQSNLQEYSDQKAVEIAARVQEAFEEVVLDTYNFSLSLSKNQGLKDQLEKSNFPELEISTLLSQLNKDEKYSLEVYDRNFELIAWSGRRTPVDSVDVHLAFAKGDRSFISQSALYRYLTVVQPVEDADKLVGIVVVSFPIEVNYPINNRFLTSSGIQAEFSRRFGTNIVFDFNPEARSDHDRKAVSTELHGVDGKKIGIVHVEKPSRNSSVEEIRYLPKRIESVLIAVLPFILLACCWSDLRRLTPLRRAAVILVVVWGARYLWLAVDFPSLFFQSGIFDPSYFASPFGLGLTESIGELLITTILLFFSMLYVVHLYVQSTQVRPSSGGGRSSVIRIVMPGLAGIIFLFVLRAYAAAMQSAVFDSKLRYVDPSTVVLDPIVAVMLFCILLLTISFLILSVILFLYSIRQLDSASRETIGPALTPSALIGVLWVGESILFGLIHPNPLTSGPYRAVVIAIVIIAAMMFRREAQSRRGILTGAVVAVSLLASLFIAPPLLDQKIHEHDREVLRQFALELTRPIDTWVRLILEESLTQMRDDPEVRHSLQSQDRDLLSGTAFRLWALSPLSRQGLNCAVGIVRQGRIESLFNIGIQRSEVSGLISSLGSFTEERTLVVRSGGQVRGLDRYLGVVPITTLEGSPLANLVIVIVSGQQALLSSGTPEILQTPSAQAIETQFRSLIVSEFVDRALVRTTAENFPKGTRVPDDVYSRLTVGNSPSVWSDDRIASKDYESLYLLWRDETGREKILALSLESLDARWHIFNLVKVVFFYLVVGSAGASAAFVVTAIRQRKVRLSFRGKLLAALLTVAIVPLIVLAYYDREFTEESREKILRHQVEDELQVVHSSLLGHAGVAQLSERSEVLTDNFCEKLAQELGIDFNVYIGKHLQASSRPELYDAELIDTRMSSAAYRRIYLEGQNSFLQTESIGKFPYLVGYQRLEDGAGHVIGAISVITAFRHLIVDQELFRRSAFIFSIYAIVSILFMSIGVFIAYKIGSPIRRLTDGMRHVSSGDLDYVVEVESVDEIGELVAAFNKMTRDLKRIQKDLASAERELAWREMAKQVAHEIKNPLTPMKLSIQHLRQAYRDRVKDFQPLLDDISKTMIDQIDALSRIATEFSRYARMPERKYETCDVHLLLSEAARLFDQQKNISCIVDFAQGKPAVVADKEELRRVFINILRNAVQAISGRGTIRVATQLLNAELRIEISDTGSGIPDEIKDRLFEPNFSTKSEGMGLGLAISKQTILDLNGRIEIESTMGKGTRVIIHLPVTTV